MKALRLSKTPFPSIAPLGAGAEAAVPRLSVKLKYLSNVSQMLANL